MVHRSGDETIADTKTFEGTINSKGGVNFVNSKKNKGNNSRERNFSGATGTYAKETSNIHYPASE